VDDTLGSRWSYLHPDERGLVFDSRALGD